MERQIVCNKIRTPDGTVLQSFHVHDYKSYIDKNGEEYMVDGGTHYLRRTVGQKVPYEELSLYLDDPFEQLREGFTWGTRGKTGKEELKFVPLSKLTSDHIQAILETQTHTPDWVKYLLQKELELRETK